MNKKREIARIWIILAVLILIGLLLFFLPKITKVIKDECKQISNENYKDSCYFDLAEETGDLSICEKLTDKTANRKKRHCYINLARETGDISICEKIKENNNYLSKEYKYNCYASVAEGTKNINICDEKFEEGSWKDSCYSNVAGQTGDNSICEKIVDEVRKNGCYFSVWAWATSINNSNQTIT